MDFSPTEIFSSLTYMINEYHSKLYTSSSYYLQIYSFCFILFLSFAFRYFRQIDFNKEKIYLSD